jgi:hypothetical protein
MLVHPENLAALEDGIQPGLQRATAVNDKVNLALSARQSNAARPLILMPFVWLQSME